MRKLVVVMGPSGAGKSLIGSALAKELGALFFEGDDFHPQANVAKMRDGSPLADKDRVAWVEAILAALADYPAPVAVLACSALTPFVQERLRSSESHAPVFLLLDAPRAVLAERIKGRADHFMPLSLLDSQIDALQPPQDAVLIDAGRSVDAVVASALRALDHQSQR